MRFLPLFSLLPLACAFFIPLCRSRKYAAGILAQACASVLLFLALFLAARIGGQKVFVYQAGGWQFPLGITLVVDGLANLMLLAVNLVALLALVYSTAYIRRYTGPWKFYCLFMLMLAGLNGVVISGDIFNLYVFLEMASLSAYGLVAFGAQAQDLEAAFKYLVMGVLASVFILLGIAFTYGYTSSLAIADIANLLAARPGGLITGFIAALFFAGFGLKAALMPFHGWLADAHSSAPAPVSAALSGVFIKSLGLYALARIFFNMLGVSAGVSAALFVTAVVSICLGALLALGQQDIKRMFAYSSISHVGYIAFAFAVGTPLALLGGLLHLFNHAVFKSLLFLNAGAIEYATGTRQLNRLGGLDKQMPFTRACALAGVLGISGIPPFAGFWGKLIVILAAAQAGYVYPALLAVLASVITLAYALRFYTRVFLGPANSGAPAVKEVPMTMKAAMLALAAISLCAGLLVLPYFRGFFAQAASNLAGRENYIRLISGAVK
jgi:multicomponent Na+:H+ antiporter subunit D